ncbi:hypothetical protein PLEOSDRAFT_1077746 [Pleurotus ostreatus PC15]|uniref:Uncharacterized protein n=1 Tax=Pleurotus ostreatus (strain PC15) TaxID=1137138 RepID=A0A067NIZ4_PLEO1|nr:hypothetical protein PLEOSDRAFT_1077746 [Pleurotus ostreatus PC15]
MSPRFVVQNRQQTSATMQTSHPHTVDVAERFLLADDGDDNEICPVCDGECTCRPQSSTPYRNVPPSTPSFTTITPKHPPLKIKLTVPSCMLGKRQISSSKSVTAYSAPENAGESSSSSSHPEQLATAPIPVPKRRGRPSKAVVAARLAAKAAAEAHEATRLPVPSLSQFSSQSQQSVKRKDSLNRRKTNPKSAASRLPSKLKGKSTVVKKANKRRRVAVSDSSAYSSDEYSHCEDDSNSVRLPTLVPASALSSSSSSDTESSSLSDFDSDSSIEAEEETYIISEESRARDKARVRRELLGDDQRRRNDWVIRPRKMSVGASDAEMEVDSDATEDEEEEEEQEEEEEEPDEQAPGAPFNGVATGWSEGEESSFDADLFFANLSSDAESTDYSAAGDEGPDDVDIEDPPSDVDAISLVQAAAAGLIPQLRQELDNLPFEVTQGWDGQIVFTNGLQDGHGILDIDFEVNAAQLVDTSASPSADVDMSDNAQDENTNGGTDDGATTDEDLVGADDLPNERAMQLFVMPMSVSAVDPMSTMSPVGSPRPVNRRRFRSSSHCESPKPADILAGRVFWEDSDGDCDDNLLKSRSETSSRGAFPRTGTFQHTTSDRRAVIDGSSNDVPSPHPRAGRIGRGRDMTQSLHSFHMFDSPWTARSFARTSSVPASGSPRSHMRSFSSDVPMSSSPDPFHGEPVNLDDVLDSSYLDSDGSDCHGSTTSVNDSDSKKHIRNLKRWDVISVGAFRQSHSSMNSLDASWTSDTPVPTSVPTSLSNAMKMNPINEMLWNNKDSKVDGPSTSALSTPESTSSKRRKRGDRTPTNYVPTTTPPQQNRIPTKTRKELRHEHKLKRKSFASTHHKHHPQFHAHGHHPNMKSRSSSSVQRTNFFSSSTSSPM